MSAEPQEKGFQDVHIAATRLKSDMNDKRLQKRWFPWIFALLMGGGMTAIVTLALTLAQDPWQLPSLLRWLQRWALAWAVATPVIVWLAPRARRMAARFAIPPEA